MNSVFRKLQSTQVLTVSVLLIISLQAFSQDSHYWNIQYGTKATLLGGAVIGSVSDLSATYYNPGAISLFNDPKLILSAKVYQYESISVQEGGGANVDLKYSSISPSPTFVAFNVNIDSTGRNTLAFSVLTRQSMKFNLSTNVNVTTAFPGVPTTAKTSGVSLLQDFDEVWAGASFSRKMNSIIGIGATTYVAYRNQKTSMEAIVEELQPDTDIASILVYRNLKFYNYRALIKAGVALNLDPVTLGLTVTTPSLNVFGSGTFGYNYFLSNPDTVSENVFESNTQYDLKTTYNTSWAIGLGAAYWGDNFNLHVSTEWYAAVKEFHPMNIEPFVAQSSGIVIQNQLNQQLKSVFNAGVGLDYILNERVTLAGSFITDFSADIDSVSSNISFTNWNIYHISAGSNFKVANAEVTLGLSASFARDRMKQLPDFEDSGGLIDAIEPTIDVQFLRIKVLFGFIF